MWVGWVMVGWGEVGWVMVGWIMKSMSWLDGVGCGGVQFTVYLRTVNDSNPNKKQLYTVDYS